MVITSWYSRGLVGEFKYVGAGITIIVFVPFFNEINLIHAQQLVMAITVHVDYKATG